MDNFIDKGSLSNNIKAVAFLNSQMAKCNNRDLEKNADSNIKEDEKSMLKNLIALLYFGNDEVSNIENSSSINKFLLSLIDGLTSNEIEVVKYIYSIVNKSNLSLEITNVNSE